RRGRRWEFLLPAAFCVDLLLEVLRGGLGRCGGGRGGGRGGARDHQGLFGHRLGATPGMLPLARPRRSGIRPTKEGGPKVSELHQGGKIHLWQTTLNEEAESEYHGIKAKQAMVRAVNALRTVVNEINREPTNAVRVVLAELNYEFCTEEQL